MKPVVIFAAVNGGQQKSRDGAFVPTTPEEIAEDAVLCREAGASVLHFHGRGPDKANTADPDVYTQIMRLVRARTDLVLQSTNGIGMRLNKETGQYWNATDQERLGLLTLDPPPDFHGAATGSVDQWNPDGGGVAESTFPNSSRFLTETIRRVYRRGSSIEFEIPGYSALHRLHRHLVQEGVDPAAPYIGLVMPILPGFVYDIPNFIWVANEARRLFPNAWRSCGGAGRDCFPAVTVGLSLGFECIRVGMEDSIYLPDGTVAPRNHDLVKKAVEIAAIFGRRPATPAEARHILHLDRNSH